MTPKKRGYMHETARLTRFLRDPLAKRRLRTLSRSDFVEWIQRRKGKGKLKGTGKLSDDMITRDLMTWRAVIRHAADVWEHPLPLNRRGQPYNPAAMERPSRPPSRKVRFSREERECLFRHAAADPNGKLVELPLRLCFVMNFRRGELVRMTRDMISWNECVITLPARIVKNGKERRVLMPPEGMAILREAVETFPEDGMNRVFPVSEQILVTRIQPRPRRSGEGDAVTRREAISRLAPMR